MAEYQVTQTEEIASTQEWEKSVDDALDMQLISIRLPKSLIKDLKIIAEAHDVGYQPLMRDALLRFAAAEFKRITTEMVNEKLRKANKASSSVVKTQHKHAA